MSLIYILCTCFWASSYIYVQLDKLYFIDQIQGIICFVIGFDCTKILCFVGLLDYLEYRVICCGFQSIILV